LARIEIDHVTKEFPGGVVAVKDACLTIADREFVVIVGPSGCGKSTTLRMVAGLEEITEGTISIGDRVVNDVPPKDRDIAMVFQNYALYPHMTDYGNMAFGLKLRRFPKEEIEARVLEAAKILGITELLDRKPKALSGGQRQRVAVGRAIVRHPAAFLFDEPLSNLDARLRVDMRAELKKLHQRLNTTMIYVTHDQVEAMTLGDRIVIMRNGIIEQVDEPLAIYRSPANQFVAGFIGTPPMNFIEGSVQQAGAGFVFVAEGMRLALPQRMNESLKSVAGRKVVFGIRPEDVTDPGGAGAAEGRSLKCRVDVVEPLGDEMIVHLAAGGQTVVAKMRAERLTPGAEVVMAVDVDRAHVFSAETGENLTRANGSAGCSPRGNA
jgi:multiple sugar transport system ATP-binding protein